MRPEAPGGTRRRLSAENAPLYFPNQSHDSFLLSSVPACAVPLISLSRITILFTNRREVAGGGGCSKFFQRALADALMALHRVAPVITLIRCRLRRHSRHPLHRSERPIYSFSRGSTQLRVVSTVKKTEETSRGGGGGGSSSFRTLL